jgi:hypothetical protein
MGRPLQQCHTTGGGSECLSTGIRLYLFAVAYSSANKPLLCVQGGALAAAAARAGAGRRAGAADAEAARSKEEGSGESPDPFSRLAGLGRCEQP